MPRKNALTPDPRHAAFKAVLAQYWAAECPANPTLPWGPRDAGALGLYLREDPALTVEAFTQMLRHRFRSDDHPPGERVFVWIAHITRYSAGPLNQFKQPQEKKHGNAKPNSADSKLAQSHGSTRAALARVRGVADRGAGPARRLPPPAVR